MYISDDVKTWAKIPDHEDYSISRDGQIYSSHSKRLKKLGYTKAQRINTYVTVTLYTNKSAYTKLLHVLVATAYIPNPENKPTVNHIDRDKYNNSVNNLEWATREEQDEHRVKNYVKAKLRDTPVVHVTPDGQIKHYDSIPQAAFAMNVIPTSIRSYLSGKRIPRDKSKWYDLSDYNMMKSGEQWKVLIIDGKMTRYDVSDHGRVKNAFTGLVLKGAIKGGYDTIDLLVKDETRKFFPVHRLVMYVFIGLCPENTTVDHIDRDPRNNKLSNLRYATWKQQAENRAYDTRDNRSIKIEMLNKDGEVLKEFSSLKKATLFATDGCYDTGSAIARVCSGKGKIAYGYRWRHKDAIFIDE